MNNKQRIAKLSAAVVEEMVNRGYADIWDWTYNPGYQIQIDLTVEELRYAAKLAGYKYKKEN